MRPLTLLFCVWILLSPALWAAPADDFTARGKELLANKEKLSDADRLHLLFDVSWDAMLRAVRLVVDTGLHSMDWSRERAIKYFEENTGNPPHDIVVEVDRYIVWPSQALGYKIGQLKIRQLRTHTEKELGANFDLRAFHDEVLKNGALPLSVLETHIHEWVAKRKGA
ncbi:MAG TPA: DUF885 family protein [Chthoniobacterales bacterium]|nr:DUF885 family protein [Chthoniobacterales bacterium]